VKTYLSAPGFDAANAAMRADHFRLPELSRLGVPVTLAWAEHDQLVAPPRGGVAGVETVAIPDAGHLAMWDQPELVAELILRPHTRRRRVEADRSPGPATRA
jgi:pimeloyl-ACP methyl ester carboxylesterase